jgi:dUTP pyrophosphatase
MLHATLTSPHARFEPLLNSSNGVAGCELRSSVVTQVPARGRELVRTNLVLKLPPGVRGRVAPPPHLAWKYGIAVEGKVVGLSCAEAEAGAVETDRSSTGELFVLLFNHSNEDFRVREGDLVAHLVLESSNAESGGGARGYSVEEDWPPGAG